MEDASTWLSCAIANLYLIQESLYADLFAMERAQTFLGTKHLMSCCDAMGAAFRELDRIKGEMDATIEAEYAKGD